MKIFEDIELTEEEMNEAIIWAKQKKDRAIKQRELEERENLNRQMLTDFKWTYEQTRGFMLYRAAHVFNGKFAVDKSNSQLFELLCHYFSSSDQFVTLAEAAGVKNASLEKGVFIYGSFGVGKTWLLRLFAKNQRQVFHVHNAKDIAKEFEVEGAESIEKYLQPVQNAFDDKNAFYQEFSGLCIDDMGTEDIKNNYGNKSNVIGDILETRYARGYTGALLHATTNLTGDQIKEYYGGRVASRMREIFNLIELKGTDRRK